MCKKAKEFSGESYLNYSSTFIFKNNSNSSESSYNKNIDYFKPKIEEMNRENQKKEISNKENQDNLNNINYINNISHDLRQNNDSNANQIDNSEVLNHVNQENNSEIHFRDIQNNQNIQNQEIMQHQNTNTANQTTRGITKTKIFNIIHPNSEEESNEGDDKIKKGKNYSNRNRCDTLIRNFFKDLVRFINNLIIKFNEEKCKEKGIEINQLEIINGNKYIHHNSINALFMLDLKAKDALSERQSLQKRDKNVELIVKDLPNKKAVKSIYEETNEDKKIYEVIFVLDMTIRDLMNIYLKKEIPEEDFFKYFSRFEDYIKSRKITKKEKRILKEVGKEYEENLKKKIFEDEKKKGPKTGYQKYK